MEEPPYFCMLYINHDITEKIKTEILFSQYPFEALENLNQKKKQKTNKELTEQQLWNIFMIIGPFGTMEESEDFHLKWKSKTRGVISRMRRGVELAALQDVNVFVETKKQSEKDQIKKLYDETKQKIKSNNFQTLHSEDSVDSES